MVRKGSGYTQLTWARPRVEALSLGAKSILDPTSNCFHKCSMEIFLFWKDTILRYLLSTLHIYIDMSQAHFHFRFIIPVTRIFNGYKISSVIPDILLIGSHKERNNPGKCIGSISLSELHTIRVQSHT